MLIWNFRGSAGRTMEKCLLLFVVSLVQAQSPIYFNFSFCRTLMKEPIENKQTGDVFFYKDFELNAERYGFNFVDNAFHQYSQSYEILKTTEETLYGTNLIVTDAFYGAMLNFNKTSEKCEDATFDGHTHNDFIHALGTYDHRTYVLAPPESILEWSSSAHLIQMYYKYLVGYTQHRGIPVAHWQSCDYDLNVHKTVVIDWYLSDNRSYTLPAGQKTILIAKVNTFEDEHVIGTEFSMFREIPDYRLVKALERPFADVCKTKSIVTYLPQLPWYFSFMGEFADRMTSSDKTSTITMGITNEVYDFKNRLCILTTKSSPHEGDKEEIETTVQVLDFNTGIRYTLNYNKQSCIVDHDIHLGIVEVPAAHGKVRMRKPQEFLHLTSAKYEYFGEHVVRGFECDTWTSYMNDSVPTEEKNTYYTWHFMTRYQMDKLGYSSLEPAIPVRLVTRHNNGYSDTDIFHFNTNRRLTVPVNLDICFNDVKTKTVKISFFGNFEQEIVKKVGVIKFTEEFRASLIRYSKVGTPLRFSDITPRRNLKDKNEIIVSFRLYPLLKHGNIVHNTDNKTTSDVLRNLKQTVDRGIFVVDLEETYLVAKTGSLQTIENPGQAVHATTRKLTGISEVDDDDGYSSGAMAGLGIAMIILGVVVGAGALFLYKRLRSSGVDAQFTMSKVKANTEA